MNQTMAFVFPSVVVEIGDRLRTSSSVLVVAHHAMDGIGGLPGRMRIDITWPFVVPPGQTPPTVLEMAT
jgi:hypothetical protein